MITVFICIGVSLFQTSAYSQSKGGRWQFEENGFDTAEWDMEDDSGVLEGQASYQSEAPLVEGDAYLYLDSTNVHAYFHVEDSGDLDFDNENIAISAWIYPLVLKDDVHYLLNKGDQYTNPKTTNYSLRISKSGNLEFLIRDAQNQAQKVASRFTIPENSWTFVGVFYNFGLGRVYMWNDSTTDPADTLEFHQDFFPNDAPLAIGSWYSSDPASPSIKDFEGRIDDVRIGTEIFHIIDGWTQCIDRASHNPDAFQLYPNYPNPFNDQTVIVFDLSERDDLTLDILDLQGRSVVRLFKGCLMPGRHTAVFRGSNLASGQYFVRLLGRDRVCVRKMILLK
jgi:hypothetical protein